MPRAIHFELYADDPERAAKFYADSFDWSVERWQGESGPVYWLLTTGEESLPGINGDIQRRSDPAAATSIILAVSSVDDYAAKIAAAGGSVMDPKFALPGIGYAAYFRDTEGNRFGIFQEDPTAV